MITPADRAIFAHFPCYPVGASGRFENKDKIRQAREARAVLIGSDGVMAIIRRPWLEVDIRISEEIQGYLPYGPLPTERWLMRCGMIPLDMIEEIHSIFTEALPNEAAAFIIWNEQSAKFRLLEPDVVEKTPARLVYRPPVLPPYEHLVCDVHSHGRAEAFFSTVDDRDDAHSTKLAIVLGNVDRGFEHVSVAVRLYVAGTFLASKELADVVTKRIRP